MMTKGACEAEHTFRSSLAGGRWKSPQRYVTARTIRMQRPAFAATGDLSLLCKDRVTCAAYTMQVEGSHVGTQLLACVFLGTLVAGTARIFNDEQDWWSYLWHVRDGRILCHLATHCCTGGSLQVDDSSAAQQLPKNLRSLYGDYMQFTIPASF